MQKELKIGLAIGAVLLVVLIVYLAVPKGNDSGDLARDLPTESVTPDEDATGEGHPNDAPGATGDKPAGEETKPPANPGPFADGEGETPAPDAPANGNDDAWAVLLTEGPKDTKITSTPLRASRVNNPGAEQPTGTTPGDQPNTGEAPPATPPGTGISNDTPPAAPETPTGDAPAPPADGAAARTHTVKRGETLSGIAETVYGEQRYYLALQKANPTVDPAKMRPGTVLNLPDAESIKGSSSASPDRQASNEKPIDSDTEYRVQSNDSLYKISVKKYGTPSMVDSIYELNKETIGNDSSKLKLGMVLKLPPKPSDDTPAR